MHKTSNSNSLHWLALFIALFFNANVIANSQVNCKQLSSTDWLMGSWQSKTNKVLITEQWRVIHDSYRVGVGTTVSLKSSKKPFIESLGLIEMAGDVFYLAKPPQNDVPVSFKLVECSANYLKFTNPQHDFPQTIEYTKHSNDSMVALVSGGDKQFDIDFRKVKGTKHDNISSVNAYVDAYNQRDLVTMLQYTSTDILWMMVYDDKVSVETNNRKELALALKQHFTGAIKSNSTLSGVARYGDFVFAVEKATSSKNGKPQSACSLSVYQFTEELIKAVWYYPAQSCE